MKEPRKKNTKNKNKNNDNKTSTPIKYYRQPKISINTTSQDESAFLKTALTLENTNIKATIEKERRRK